LYITRKYSSTLVQCAADDRKNVNKQLLANDGGGGED